MPERPFTSRYDPPRGREPSLDSGRRSAVAETSCSWQGEPGLQSGISANPGFFTDFGEAQIETEIEKRQRWTPSGISISTSLSERRCEP
jgi:hypothetical protein